MHSVTASGQAVSLLSPTPETISLRDIAHGLALITRWCGATQVPLSVAQHSIIVADQLPPDWRGYGLLHDGHEALTGDITTPMKQALRAVGAGDAVDRIACAIDKAIHARAGLPWPVPQDIAAAIQQADQRARDTEARDLLPLGAVPITGKPLPHRIRPLAWPAAEAAYLQALATYIPALRHAA